MKAVTSWGIMWRDVTKAEGDRRHLLMEDCVPVLFQTRARANAYIKERYGYIAKRPDLRGEPHGWRMPRPVRVRVSEAQWPNEGVRRFRR